MKKFAFAFGTMTLLGAYSCTNPGYLVDSTCDPDALLPDERCRALLADAGTDAESDAGPDGASLRPEGACLDNGGECIPKPSDSNAYKWEGPAPVWIGPASEKPTECPFDGVIVARKYGGLHAPPLDCAPCECEESTGKCAGVPDSISVGTTTCMMGGISIPFDGPGGWDGSCTNENAIFAGAECPPGSGTPCVQSIAWSALTGPQDEACAVKVKPVPTFNGMTTSWETAAVACDSSMADDLCGDGKRLCTPDARLPWVQCIWTDSKDAKCPDDYSASRHEMYEQDPVDSRACTACSCGEPVGGSCIANLRAFTDSTCGAEILNLPISSSLADCYPIFPAGSAIGAKSITDHLYLPGTCTASGGEPIGEAVEDKAQTTTFCCRLGKFFTE